MRSLQIGTFLIPIQETIPTASNYLYLENIWCFAGIDMLCVLCSKQHLIHKAWVESRCCTLREHFSGMEPACSGRAAERPFCQSPWCPLTAWVMPSPPIPYDSHKEMLAEAQLSHPSQLQKHDLGCWVKDVPRYRFATANAPLETADYSSATN